jgi:very-short-patch-repair endonuclease
MKKNKIRTIEGARLLRKNMTEAEKILWRFLSDRGMCKFKFRRQHPINGFIIDFFCPEKKLAVEIDGDIHNDQKEYDQERRYILESQGIKFLRFNNNQVLNDIDFVLKIIKNQCIPLHSVERGVPTKSGRGEDG